MIAPANPPKLPELDYAAIDAAIARGIREAVLNRARMGLPVSTWKDGKVVILSPAEILASGLADDDTGK